MINRSAAFTEAQELKTCAFLVKKDFKDQEELLHNSKIKSKKTGKEKKQEKKINKKEKQEKKTSLL